MGRIYNISSDKTDIADSVRSELKAAATATLTSLTAASVLLRNSNYHISLDCIIQTLNMLIGNAKYEACIIFHLGFVETDSANGITRILLHNNIRLEQRVDLNYLTIAARQFEPQAKVFIEYTGEDCARLSEEVCKAVQRLNL
ncbi:MAG: hypothetical protein V1837_06470 [Candidatus Woesearchaeota archaeon]